MRILVLGGYGLIGGETVRLLIARGHEVIGAGRDLGVARRRFPGMAWMAVELGRTDAAGWAERLQSVEVVVNAAGVLQDGLREDLRAVHVTGLQDLVEGCRRVGVRRLVHLSAAGVAPGRGGGFNDAKAEGEAVVARSGLEWVILRPGLVFAPTAFGGTALLRGLAGFPGCIPCVAPAAMIQPVSVATVAQAAVEAVERQHLRAAALDLVGSDRLPLGDVLKAMRAWLGLPPAPVLALPAPAARVAARFADALGWLGWRTPMRTNAIEQIELGMASAGGGEAALGLESQGLAEILAGLPSTLQERRFARLYFAKPAALAGLATLCALTGVLSFARFEASRAILAPAGLPGAVEAALVAGGAGLDLLIAAGVCLRATAAKALVALIALSGAYVVAGLALRPDLWLDPLTAFPKTLLVMLLAGLTLGTMDER